MTDELAGAMWRDWLNSDREKVFNILDSAASTVRRLLRENPEVLGLERGTEFHASFDEYDHGIRWDSEGPLDPGDVVDGVVYRLKPRDQK